MAWLSICSEVQTCIWPSWCHGHSLSLASVKSSGFTFLVPAHPGSPGWRAVKRVCVCVFLPQVPDQKISPWQVNQPNVDSRACWPHLRQSTSESPPKKRIPTHHSWIRYGKWQTVSAYSADKPAHAEWNVPIQLAQCWFPGLAISNAKYVYIFFLNVRTQFYQTALWNCYGLNLAKYWLQLKKLIYCVIYYNFRHTFVPYDNFSFFSP